MRLDKQICYLEMLAALKVAQFALNSVRNTSLKHPDFRSTYEVAAFVDRAIARGALSRGRLASLSNVEDGDRHYYREFTMPKLRTLVCPHCQSENITRDGLLQWSTTLQAWEMSSELDNMTCNDCGEDLEFADWSDSDLSADAATKLHEFTGAQRDTILAALRYWQMAGCISRATSEFEEIATNGGAHPPLTADQIDVMCEQINIGPRR